MAATSRIILLNGNSSVGKSSIAKALQTITIEPFLHVAMDAFLDMMPPSLLQGSEGMVFEPGMEDGVPICAIKVGPQAMRTLSGMRRAMRAMADAGNNLVIDDVLIDQDWQDYVEALSGHRVSWVGVFAPLQLLEERERRRGDRDLGLARWLQARLHKDIKYDLELDTSQSSAMECAIQIKRTFDL